METGGQPKRKKQTRAPEPGSNQVTRKKTQEERQAEEWEATALGLKNDGYNSGVVTRKMITQFGMTEPAAEELVGRLFGKKVSARAGDTTAAVLAGIGMAVAALVGMVVVWWFVGFTPPYLLLFYAMLLGIAGKGISQALMAIINVNAKEDLVKKD